MEACIVTMCATVCEVCCDTLLVRDHSTCTEVLVHTSEAHCFCVCDQVRIEYTGIMTLSIPPQISAISITKLFRCGNRRC